MSTLQRDPTRHDQQPGLGPTDPEPVDERDTAPSPDGGPDAETGDFTPVPPTAVSTDGGVEGPRASGTGRVTESVVAPRPDPDTASFASGGATAERPAGGPDRDATASFDL